MTDTDVLIVGAGLSGLALARHLTAAGVAHEVLEGRARIGGRILSAVGGMDLGPAWIWPGQPRIAALLADLGLATFAQHSRGMLVYEDRGGAIRRDLTFSTMEGALRVTGGLSRVTDGLASGLAPVRLGAEVRADRRERHRDAGGWRRGDGPARRAVRASAGRRGADRVHPRRRSGRLARGPDLDGGPRQGDRDL
jgi:monoamine oxidase